MIKVKSRDSFLELLSDFYIPKESRVVEIGVLHGDFSEKIIKIINPKCLFLIDPYKVEPSVTYGSELNNLPVSYSTGEDYLGLIKRFENDIRIGKVFVLKNYSHKIVKGLQDNIFDFIYIDASHKYDDVKKDLNDWLPKLKENGVIAGHDYIELGSFGVIKAIDEFTKEHGFEMILYNDNGGDWALKKIKK